MINTKGCKINKKELNLGIPIEFEHTKSRRFATKIARQHICEFPSYYSKWLIPMERKLKSQRRLNK
jgi:hypothetical protein